MAERARRDLDALAFAALVALVVLGVVVVVDLATDAKVEPSVLALFAAAIGPVVAAFLARRD